MCSTCRRYRRHLRAIANRNIRVHVADSRTPSPFASALLFSYVANYIYDGDAPLAERRAQALSIDQEQLRELLGDADLRELLDANAIEETEEQLQSLAEGYKARNLDAVHDLLLRLGDLTAAELASTMRRYRCRRERCTAAARAKSSTGDESMASHASSRLRTPRECVTRSAFLCHQVFPRHFLRRLQNLWSILFAATRARTGRLRLSEVAKRYALSNGAVEPVLQRLVGMGRIVEGGFRPSGVNREWIDVEVLRTIRRRSLARLRKEVEPVEQRTLARLFTRWQGVVQPRRGLDALLDVIETLQGAALPASLLETEILPARIAGYTPSDLDTLIAAGEVVWVGLEPLGERDGRIGLYLADKLALLWPPDRVVVADATSADRARSDERARAGGDRLFDSQWSVVLSAAA